MTSGKTFSDPIFRFERVDDPKQALIQECRRQEETCLYTSTSLFIWLRQLRQWQFVSVVAPLVLGGIAGWNMLGKIDSDKVQWIAGVCALLAGLVPSIFAAVKFDDRLALCKVLSAEFKNLQDRFRQLAVIGGGKSLEQVETEFRSLMDRMEQTRSHSFTAPEWTFKMAKEKIEAGHYKFDADKAP